VSLRRDTLWSLVAVAGPAPLTLAATVVLARSLGAEAHGQVQAALSLWVLAATVGNAGFVAASIHQVRRLGRPAAEALGTGLLGVTLAGGGLALVMLLGQDMLRREVLLGAPPSLLIGVLVLLAPTLWGAVAGGVARATDRFSLWTRMEWLSRGGRLVAWACLWAAGLASPTTVLFGAAVVELGVVGAGAWGLRAEGRPRRGSLGDAARFGLPASATAIGGQLHERVDLFLLAALRGDPTEVAVYAVAVGVVGRLRVVPLAVAAALFPAVASAERAEGVALARRAVGVSVGGSLGLALGVLAVAPWVVPWLFGAVYADAVLPMAVLAPGAVAYGVYLVLARWFQGVERQRVNLAALGAATSLNVVLNLWWIPRYGALGAAAASAVSYGLQGAWVAVTFMRAGRA
jgi:O-antigen/teichoic acid export membrane protein